jgi:hypothetical protein
VTAFMVYGLWFMVYGLWFRNAAQWVTAFDIRVYGLGFRV